MSADARVTLDRDGNPWRHRWRSVWWLAQHHADRALGPYLPHVDPWHERAVDRILLGLAALRGGSRERRRR